jgi:hypothetical protein
VATSVGKALTVKPKKRTETTIEAHEVWVVRGADREPPAWCGVCADYRGMLTPENAARLRNVGTRAVYRWVEDGRLHFNEAPDGRVFICLASLVSLAAGSV